MKLEVQTLAKIKSFINEKYMSDRKTLDSTTLINGLINFDLFFFSVGKSLKKYETGSTDTSQDQKSN